MHRHWRQFALCLLVTGVLPAGGHAQTAAPPAPSSAVPVEQFFQNPALRDAKLSPSGKRLALTTSYRSERVSLVVVELQPSPVARRVALFSDADIVKFAWTSDDHLIFSVLDLKEGSGEDRRLAPGLYSVTAQGDDLRQLVRRRGTPFVVDGRSIDHRSLEWYHTLLKVPHQQPEVEPDEVVIGRLNFSGEELGSVTPLWLNARTGRTRPMDVQGAPASVLKWLFDSRGEARVAVSVGQGEKSVYWRGPKDNTWRKLSQSPLLESAYEPIGVDDRGILYVIRSQGANGEAVLTRYDFAAGQPEPAALASAPGFDFRGGLILDHPGSHALGVRIETDAEQTIWFDPDLKAMQQLADGALPGRVNRISCRRCGAPDAVMLVRSFSDRDPGRLLIYQAGRKKWQSIGSVMPDIDPRQMARVDMRRIKARDGQDLPVWLTLPQGAKPGHPAPAVVMVHGGPWVRGGHWQWEPMEQFLASRGYLVISPEFRGSRGYGDVHFRAGFKQWGQAMQNDVADALQWARQQGLADPERACIAGSSYGGYSALMGLIRHPELYRCGVAWLAVTDLPLYVEGRWWVDDDVSSTGRRYTLPEMVGDARLDRELLLANSPLHEAGQLKRPLLLAMGEDDRRVPLVHGTRLRDALTEAGNPPEWVSYPGEAHGWRKLETRVDFARRIEKFLATHLRTPAAPER